MATNPYFNHLTFTTEQNLYENLIIESIKMWGMDIIYMPRKDAVPDQIFTEETGSVFEDTYTIEMYLKSTLDFRGAGDMMSKFGLQIQDQATMVVAIKRFEEEIGDVRIRPREGDMLYIPTLGEIYEIKFVEHEAIFHAFGELQTYELDIELATYDNLVFRTGIAAIDDKAIRMTLDRNVIVLTDPSGNAILAPNSAPISIALAVQDYDRNAQNESLEVVADGILDWSEIDPFLGKNF